MKDNTIDALTEMATLKLEIDNLEDKYLAEEVEDIYNRFDCLQDTQVVFHVLWQQQRLSKRHRKLLEGLYYLAHSEVVLEE